MKLIADTVRRLKRRWPTKITYWQKHRDSIDPITGLQEFTGEPFKIRRAILLPQKEVHSFFFNLAHLAGVGVNSIGGGTYGDNHRFVIIDGKDLPKNFECKTTDYIEQTENGGWWEVVEAQKFDQGEGYIVKIKQTRGVNLKSLQPKEDEP